MAEDDDSKFDRFLALHDQELLDEVARTFEATRERIREIEENTLQKLRDLDASGDDDAA